MIIGKRISGRYKVKEMVGGGGMANVYLAHDIILDRDVAVKVLRMDFSEDDEFIRRFRREAQSATSLAHPNIVSIYDVGEEDDLYYIVMEYVEGMTLKQYIQKQHPVPLERSMRIMEQLTDAIAHAHQNGIIHRDIKPQNILINERGTVKITDFGIAMALSATSITQTNSVLGSVHYLSPEQARGGMATKKSDLYSLGIVMFELLTGRLPFYGESAVSIALKHLQSETPSLKRWAPDLPQAVENVVLQATAKDPFYRFETAESMEAALQTALLPENEHVRPFATPKDEDATKAIPIISDDSKLDGTTEDTIVNTKTKERALVQPEPEAVQKKRKKWPWIVAVLIVLLLIGGLFAYAFSQALFGPTMIQVPDVSGEKVDDAIDLLEEAGFVVVDETEIETSDTVEAGLVIETNPNAGSREEEGSEIVLVESSGKEMVEVGDYTNRSYDQVIRLLEDIPFQNIVKEEIFSEEDVGTVLDQSVEAGSEVVVEETELVLTVSKGQEQIELQDLTEYTGAQLAEYEESTGLKIEVTGEEYHEFIEAGLVISQDPEPGSRLVDGDTVSVTVSKGKEEAPPQKVSRTFTIEYLPAEEGAVQEVQVYIDDLNNSMTEPFETFTLEETVERTYEFTIAEGTRAGIKVVRDSKVIIDDVIPYEEQASEE
ncbi:Stk1 family PASTA domain-containing Ser/Thr kinase [Bacillus fonticola]|uniref:Stk1 family PASTA domain-containing Ser/Thr kinase n=1 Tax=Bacillus fonticola TaxID=2728853 RepID=UPI00147619D0|nr:Stk1 family PASTA domain-containing Ser/Thr kinase [Bacillus fonticola]